MGLDRVGCKVSAHSLPALHPFLEILHLARNPPRRSAGWHTERSSQVWFQRTCCPVHHKEYLPPAQSCRLCLTPGCRTCHGFHSPKRLHQQHQAPHHLWPFSFAAKACVCRIQRCNCLKVLDRSVFHACASGKGRLGGRWRWRRGHWRSIVSESQETAHPSEKRTYAPMIATAKAACCSLHDVLWPSPIGELFSGPHLLDPSRVMTAIAIMAPQKQTSRTTAMNAMNVTPPKKHVRRTAKPV